MILDNPVFWQSVVFMLWGYISASVLHSVFSYPFRYVESA